jgi:cholesterol oxidase
VLDGSSVAANLGVNPSLTIAAQAERACAHWPNAGEEDPRGSGKLEWITPKRPAVPAEASAALRLTPRRA